MPVEERSSMITGGELTTAARAASAIRRVLRRPDPIDVLKRRQAVRDEIDARLAFPKSGAPEIVVIRLGDQDKYPGADSRRFGFAASPWFKYEVKGLHDRGLEVYTGIQHVRIRKSSARRVDDDKARKVYVVGRVLYERIVVMDWNRANDPAYQLVRFYVAYGWRGPLREVVLYDMPDSYGYEAELHGVKYKPDRVPPWTQIAWELEDRHEQKRLGLKHRYDD